MPNRSTQKLEAGIGFEPMNAGGAIPYVFDRFTTRPLVQIFDQT